MTANPARSEWIARASAYANNRWGVEVSPADAASLLKAVPDAELESLALIIVDQHMDDHGFPDPLDSMDYAAAKRWGEHLEELGFENPAK